VILAIAVVAASCSGSTTPPGVVLEARWQCDVQRLTFDDLSALDAELEGRVAAAGMTIDEYTVERISRSSFRRREGVRGILS